MTRIFMFPGQGSQRVGMGRDLFPFFPDLVEEANKNLGYSISELCLKNPQGKLRQTQFTQPALYIVSVLSYLQLESKEGRPDFVVGHSLGEYGALFAAGAFDFITGLKLVQKRGELMGRVSGSAMAAVIGISQKEIHKIFENENLPTLEIANLNDYEQIVISGSTEDIKKAKKVFEKAQARYIILNVSAAFHSRYMENVKTDFSLFIRDYNFQSLNIPVISNVTAKPYENDQIHYLLGEQITSSVRWVESVEYLLQTITPSFIEVGPGKVLSTLVKKIEMKYSPPKPRNKKKHNLIFMLSGQGSQYYQMGKELYENNNTFYRWMNNCNEVVQSITGISVIDELYKKRNNRFEEFSNTLVSHPANFMIVYSLAKVIDDWGLQPDILLGYSLGEYTAAAVAGILDWEDALKIIVKQATLVEKYTPEANILAVLHDIKLLEEFSTILERSWLASHNFSKHFAVTIRAKDFIYFKDLFEQRNINFSKLPISHGFHSPLIDSVEKDFKEYLSHISLKETAVTVMSPCTQQIAKQETEHLWNAVRQKVEFKKTIDKIEEHDERNIYLDLGPSGTLATFVKYNLLPSSSSKFVPMLNQFGQNIKSITQAKELLKELKCLS